MKNSIQEVVSQIRVGAQGRSIVFVSGNFNILHPGHIRFLNFAKTCGEFLVAGIHSDTHEGVLFPQVDRIHGIKSLSLIDFVFGINFDLREFLKELKPSVVVKGYEHEGRQNLEREILSEYAGKLIFSSGESMFSSIELIQKDFVFSKKLLSPAQEYITRHGLTLDKIRNSIYGFQKLNILVVGDTIVDDYITCEALGLSQEDPTIVVSPIASKQFIGGASIVAAHASGLGAKVRFFSVIGADQMGAFVESRLQDYRVEANLIVDETRPTTLKQRVRSQEKTLLRINHLSQRSISSELAELLVREIQPSISWADLIVFSDFSYGCLPQSLVDAVTNMARPHKKFLVADSQSSSQTGDICRFVGMNLITPTEREARLGLRDKDSGLVVLAEKLAQKTSAQNVCITLGAEGLLVYSKTERQFHTDQLPALNRAPRDPAGAGDSLLVASAMALASGNDIWTSALIGSIAAGCQVSRIGNVPLSTEELIREVSR